MGNVGQLAIDLILVAAGPKRVSAVSHPAVLPVVGADPLDETNIRLMTAFEGKRVRIRESLDRSELQTSKLARKLTPS